MQRRQQEKRQRVLAASEGSSNSRLKSSDIFIRQSARTDYCGIYCSAMLISLLSNVKINRNEILRRFKKRRGGPVKEATYLEMLEVLSEGIPGSKFFWKVIGSKRPLVKFVLMSNKIQLPTILCFEAKLKGFSKLCTHAVIVIEARTNEIRVIDTLSPFAGELDWNANLEYDPGQLCWVQSTGLYQIPEDSRLRLLICKR